MGHVDLEMVQEVFLDFRGEPLRMVIRSAQQVKTWAEAAGFEVLQTECDGIGHYLVTLAQKPARQKRRDVRTARPRGVAGGFDL